MFGISGRLSQIDWPFDVSEYTNKNCNRSCLTMCLQDLYVLSCPDEVLLLLCLWLIAFCLCWGPMNLGSDRIMEKSAQSCGYVLLRSRAVSEDHRWTTVFSRTWCLFEAWSSNEWLKFTGPVSYQAFIVMECSLFCKGLQKLSMVMWSNMKEGQTSKNCP